MKRYFQKIPWTQIHLKKQHFICNREDHSLYILFELKFVMFWRIRMSSKFEARLIRKYHDHWNLKPIITKSTLFISGLGKQVNFIILVQVSINSL